MNEVCVSGTQAGSAHARARTQRESTNARVPTASEVQLVAAVVHRIGSQSNLKAHEYLDGGRDNNIQHNITAADNRVLSTLEDQRSPDPRAGSPPSTTNQVPSPTSGHAHERFPSLESYL